MNKKIVVGAMIAAAMGLGLYGYKVLPDMVTVQVDLSGNPSNTYPKLLAIASQTVLIIGGIGYYFSKEREKSFLILAVVGILVSVITLMYNT